MTRTILDFTPDGLKKRLADMERRLADMERRGVWQHDRESVSGEGSEATSNAAALLIVAASGDSIASGGDLVAFGSTIYNSGFSAPTVGAQAVVWPTTAVGEIQVEFAWASYQDGGKIEIEVDGVVPAWGLIADATTGQVGCKRRSVHIESGQEVSVRVTQTSGSAHTADVLVEFCIPDPAVPGPGAFIETVWLDTLNNNTATSSAPLQAGVSYLIEVEGTADFSTGASYTQGTTEAVMYPSAGASNTANIDAETQFAAQAIEPAPPNHSTHFTMDLGSGASHIEPVGGPYSTPSAGHSYTYNVVGEGSPVTFATADTPSSDNNGRFRIDIHWVDV